MRPVAERRPVRLGIDRTTYLQPCTRRQAERIGRRHLPADLARAGFTVVVSASDPELHGGQWWRIDYCKDVPTQRTGSGT